MNLLQINFLGKRNTFHLTPRQTLTGLNHLQLLFHKLEQHPQPQAPILNLEKLISKIKLEKPKLLCIANPNSPTGTIIQKKDILKLIKICLKYKCLMLIDEAYYGFCKETSKQFVKNYKNIFIVRSLSKAWGLAGLRLGYIISNKKNIELLNKIRPMYEINTFGAEFLKLLLNKKYLKQINLILKDMIYARKISPCTGSCLLRHVPPFFSHLLAFPYPFLGFPMSS